MAKDFNWDDEATERLKKLWSEGLSASQIAGHMGRVVTRNAVIGKIHRLGLSGRSTKPRPRRTATKTKTTERKGWGAAKKTPWEKAGMIPTEPIVVVEELVIPVAERKTVQTLTETSCRWPIGDPQMADFHFCGKDKVLGLPYCEHHARRAVAPRPQRKPVEPAVPRDYVLVEG